VGGRFRRSQREAHEVVVKSGWVAVAVGCGCEALYGSGHVDTGWWLGEGKAKRSAIFSRQLNIAQWSSCSVTPCTMQQMPPLQWEQHAPCAQGLPVRSCQLSNAHSPELLKVLQECLAGGTWGLQGTQAVTQALNCMHTGTMLLDSTMELLGPCGTEDEPVVVAQSGILAELPEEDGLVWKGKKRGWVGKVGTRVGRTARVL